MEIKLAVKGIISRDDGKILIVRRSPGDDHKPGVWETVGGGFEGEGTLQEALKREILEEVGLEVRVREPFNTFTFVKDTGERKVGITYVCDYVSGDVSLSDEHDAFEWINPLDFKKYESVQSLYDEVSSYANKFSKDHERFVISQKGIIIKDGRCLICEVDKKPNIWDLPGGRIDVGESGQVGFAREMREEIGITEFKLISVVDYEIWYTKSGFAVCGLANLITTEQEIIFSNEHTRLYWVSLEEVDQYEFIWPSMQRMIKRAFEIKNKFS